MICKICQSRVELFQKAVILKKYNIAYYKCTSCGFVHTEDPFWLQEAYLEPINISDTGILSRNLYYSQVAAVLIYFLFDKRASFLDYAGGYGIFTRLMRDDGFDFYWHDAYAQNLFARGFEYPESLGKVEMVTSFESFEHFSDPLKEIGKILTYSENILFSTEILPSCLPDLDKWWYYGLDHGQHLSIYTLNALRFAANKFNLNLYTNGRNVHLLTRKKVNPVFLNFLIKFNRFGAYYYVKRAMSSKTFVDHLAVSSRKN